MNAKENSKKCRKTTFDVYVGHLPKFILENKIKLAFSKYGEIVDVLCRHGNGPFGYAIVKFKYRNDADKVLQEVNKVCVDGYEMEVKNGKRSNQSVENGEGASHGKTVSFCDPAPSISPMGNVHCVDTSLQARNGNFMLCTQTKKDNLMPVLVEIICTNVENAVTFYGCLVNRYDELQDLSMKLNSICPNLNFLLRKPALNNVYGALYEDSQWYRCSVIHSTVPSKSGVCIVDYIDYGNIAEVSYTNMVELPEPLKKIPPCAVKCILTNLVCNPKCRSDISFLHHWVYQRMSLSALTSWGQPLYYVSKCSAGGIDVVNELVRNGFAVYRSQVSPKLPSFSHAFEMPGSSRNQENQKFKKSSTVKANSKKVGMVCNGVGKHSNEATNEVNNTVKSLTHKSCSPDGSQHATSQSITPKRIAQRGNSNDMKLVSSSMQPQVSEDKTVNEFSKIDTVSSNLALVNNFRNLVSRTSDDPLIENAVDLLMKDLNITVSEDKKDHVENTLRRYTKALNDIKACTDQEVLSDLKKRKTHERNLLHKELEQFLESFDLSLLTKRKKIQELITGLGSNSSKLTSVYLSRTPDTVEEFLTEYHKERDHRLAIIQNARDNTNEKHERFLNVICDFQKEFSLNMLDENSNDSYSRGNTGGRRENFSQKFQNTLIQLDIALNEELNILNVTKDNSCITVIQYILDKLDIPKERIDTECELFKKYMSLFDDLKYTSDLKFLFDELCAVKENIKTLTSDSIDCDEKLHSRLTELHSYLLQEDTLLENLARASSQHFPEFVLEHPELNLHEYQNWYLLKSSWNKAYFPVILNCSRIEPSYTSKFAEEPVVIKKFDISCESERNAIVKKAISWNKINSKSLVRIKALINKDENCLYAVLPSVWETLYENPLSVPVDNKMACYMLQQILKGLYDIHKKGIVHGAVNPMAVLRKDSEVLLDFNCDRKFLQDELCLKGINFQVPNGENIYKQGDMYGFGCLVLWVLFPNLSFTSTAEGVPNISAFRSIIQELLSDKDYESLSQLLLVNQDIRPSSKKLQNSNFLNNLRIISETKP